MNKYLPLILAAALTGLTSAVVAETPDYTFISAEYSRFSSEIDGFSERFDGNGASFDLSVAVTPNFSLMAGYSNGSADVTLSGARADADIDSVLLGVMVHLSVNDTTDFIVAVGFINGKAEVNVNGAFSATVDADGGVSMIGFRAMKSDKLEINGFIRKTSIEETTNIGISLGAAYYIGESVSVDLGYLFDSDNDSLTLAVTKYF
jgi:hypothetical protein